VIDGFFSVFLLEIILLISQRIFLSFVNVVPMYLLFSLGSFSDLFYHVELSVILVKRIPDINYVDILKILWSL
jgi:hypothetical protein